MFTEQQTGQSLLEASSTWPELLSEAALAADPGLAAAASGGAILSQTFQWCLVTLGGLVCAAFSQQVLLPPGNTASVLGAKNIAQTEFSFSNSDPVLTEPVSDPRREASSQSQVIPASFETKAAPPALGPNSETFLQNRVTSADAQPPAKLELSPIRPAKLQTTARLETSHASDRKVTTSPKPCVPAPCQETTRGRLFGGRRNGK